MAQKNPTAPAVPVKAYTITDAATALRCSTKTIRRKIADGTIPAYRLLGSHHWRISADVIDALAAGGELK